MRILCMQQSLCLLSEKMRHQEWAAPSDAGMVLERGWASGRLAELMVLGPRSPLLGSGAAIDSVGILHSTSWHPTALLFSCWHHLCLKEALQKVVIMLVQH